MFSSIINYNFSNWISENYDIADSEAQEVINIIYDDKTTRNSIYKVVTLLNSLKIPSKTGITTMLEDWKLFLKVTVFVTSDDDLEVINEQLKKLSAFSGKARVNYDVCCINQEKYNNIRTRQHRKTGANN